MRGNRLLFSVLLILSSHSLFSQQYDSTIPIERLYMILEKACKKEMMTGEDCSLLIQIYANAYADNAEISEYRNEALFTIIDSHNIGTFLTALKKDSTQLSAILCELRHPVNDHIDLLIRCIKAIQKTEEEKWLIKEFESALEQALSNYKPNL